MLCLTNGFIPDLEKLEASGLIKKSNIDCYYYVIQPITKEMLESLLLPLVKKPVRPLSYHLGFALRRVINKAKDFICRK